jgi:hypothetical protein
MQYRNKRSTPAAKMGAVQACNFVHSLYEYVMYRFSTDFDHGAISQSIRPFVRHENRAWLKQKTSHKSSITNWINAPLIDATAAQQPTE